MLRAVTLNPPGVVHRLGRGELVARAPAVANCAVTYRADGSSNRNGCATTRSLRPTLPRKSLCVRRLAVRSRARSRHAAPGAEPAVVVSFVSDTAFLVALR